MFINSSNKISFGVNLNSPKLRFNKQDFFVKIRGYKEDANWACKVIQTADAASNLINSNTNPENVLKFVALGIREANQLCAESYKRFHSGLLRVFREGWLSEDHECNMQTCYDRNRYKSYKTRFDNIFHKPLADVGIGMTRPNELHMLVHGDKKYINASLEKIFKNYNKLVPKYTKKDITSNDMKSINKIIAEIRWILAHSSPWARGSDAISNVFIRSLYKALGIKCYPLKEGVSLDLEAYCTELKDYKNNFSSYFEKAPEIV